MIEPGLPIAVGSVRLFIPPPPTSLIGIVLAIAGAALRLIDYFGGEGRRGGRRRTDVEMGGESG